MTTIDAMFCLICIYGVIGMCYTITTALPDSANKFFSKTSSNLNTIYVIQWFLIPVTYIFIVYFKRDVVFNDLSLVVISIIEIAVCTTLAAAYKNAQKNHAKEGK